MAGIFVSHSSEDANLVLKFVDLLCAGIGVPREKVFCSSVPGQISPGRDFKAEIRRNLAQSSLLIPILSEAFNASRFCMFELGASWGQSKLIVPILVPPTSIQDMAAIIKGVQAIQINTDQDLSAMRDEILKNMDIAGQPTAVWESKKAEFTSAIAGLIGCGNSWLYALISSFRNYNVIGCFITRRTPNGITSVTATGRAYWLFGKRVSLRGEWRTIEESLLLDSRLFLHYEMESPARGLRIKIDKPSTLQGIIVLDRKSDYAPLRGSTCFSGYVHDLFDWRDNTASMYAERVDMSWGELVSAIETHGREIFELFSTRLGPP